MVDTSPTHLGGVGGVTSKANLEAVGFDASIWGLLPSLGGLKAVKMTYPTDLAPGLAGWLIPRSVTAMGMELGAQRLSAGMDGAPGSAGGLSQDIVGFFAVRIYSVSLFLTAILTLILSSNSIFT